jgi:hypothetical protein
MVKKSKPIPIALQACLLRVMYPGSKVITGNAQLRWDFQFSPSPLSNLYKVRINYNILQKPNVYVITPLTLAKGKTELPHVYDTTKQRLCLYYPDGREWNSSMHLAKTVVPWIYDWLYHYEFWLGSGEWLGGGIHNQL